jgi:hypothetical protein
MSRYSNRYDLFPKEIEGESAPRIVGLEAWINQETPSYSRLQEPSKPDPFFEGNFFSSSYDDFEKIKYIF